MWFCSSLGHALTDTAVATANVCSTAAPLLVCATLSSCSTNEPFLLSEYSRWHQHWESQSTNALRRVVLSRSAPVSVHWTLPHKALRGPGIINAAFIYRLSWILAMKSLTMTEPHFIADIKTSKLIQIDSADRQECLTGSQGVSQCCWSFLLEVWNGECLGGCYRFCWLPAGELVCVGFSQNPDLASLSIPCSTEVTMQLTSAAWVTYPWTSLQRGSGASFIKLLFSCVRYNWGVCYFCKVCKLRKSC